MSTVYKEKETVCGNGLLQYGYHRVDLKGANLVSRWVCADCGKNWPMHPNSFDDMRADRNCKPQIINMKTPFLYSDLLNAIDEVVAKEMNVGRLSESGVHAVIEDFYDGIANKQYGDPTPCTYQPVKVYCPNPFCDNEKTVTPATSAWPRCDDCDEPMRREHEKA